MVTQLASLRQDIDGLRAVAVLCVIAHHIAPGAVPGGFVGVDIFFVISGFLVTRLIDEAMHAGRFRYVEFIWKRCRRIVPALIALLIGTLVMGACVLTGPELVGLARHVAAGSISASNLLLWHEVGYFDTSAALKPLLHLWSLGVEEQFYVVWPLLLSLLPLDRRIRLLGILALVVFSLLLSENLAYADPSQAFYMLLSRAWELGVGGVLALALPLMRTSPAFRVARLPGLRAAASLTGASLIVASVTTLTNRDAWPGVAALLPVIGTALLIAVGPRPFLNRVLLSATPAQWIGQRSYALYLWHWPPLAFLHIIAQELQWTHDATRWAAMLLMIPVVAVAHVSLLLVERPVRIRAAAIEAREAIRMRHLLPYGAGLASIALVAVLVMGSHGLPARYGTLAGVDAETMLRAASPDSITAYDRFATRCRLADAGTATWCWRIGGASEEGGVAVIGDSHAEVIFAGLVEQRRGASLLLTGRKGCAPIVQHTPIADRTAEICRRATLLAHEAIRGDTRIATVLIVSRGAAYITGSGFGVDSQRPVVPVAIGRSAHDTLALRNAYALGLEAAIQSFAAAGKRVMLVSGVPELGFLPAECIIARPFGLRTLRTPCAVPRNEVDRRNAPYRDVVREVAGRNPSLELFDATALFCDARRCGAVRDGRLLYQDGNHLTLAGSRIVAARLGDMLRTDARRLAVASSR